ncbi:hypothetical protein E4T56_gene7156 [Termitomyces sp. T112]|nr:hypothetical protein E4T56_gene7156 [Termitomyces sp. T112]
MSKRLGPRMDSEEIKNKGSEYTGWKCHTPPIDPDDPSATPNQTSKISDPSWRLPKDPTLHTALKLAEQQDGQPGSGKQEPEDTRGKDDWQEGKAILPPTGQTSCLIGLL